MQYNRPNERLNFIEKCVGRLTLQDIEPVTRENAYYIVQHVLYELEELIYSENDCTDGMKAVNRILRSIDRNKLYDAKHTKYQRHKAYSAIAKEQSALSDNGMSAPVEDVCCA